MALIGSKKRKRAAQAALAAKAVKAVRNARDSGSSDSDKDSLVAKAVKAVRNARDSGSDSDKDSLVAKAVKAVRSARDSGSDSDKGGSGGSGGRLRWLFVGAGLGAVAYHFLGPVSGRSRRADTAQQDAAGVREPLKKAQDELEKTATLARDRAEGLAHEVTSSESDKEPADDRTLVNKVRSEALGGEEWSDTTINVNAVDGVVTLRGQLDSRDRIEKAIEATRGVPGVKRVESFLHTPGSQAPNTADVRDVATGGL